MTGEMSASEVTRDNWPVHFAIADALDGEVKPFDHYQGPYVVVGDDVRAGSEPYAVAPVGLGVLRFWVCSENDGMATIYNEATDKWSKTFSLCEDDTCERAVEAARSVT